MASDRLRIYTESTQSYLGLHRVYTEHFHVMQIYTESTRCNFWSTQSLDRVMQIYTESTQSNGGLHRVYTEQFWDYTESTQIDIDLHRVYTE